MLIYSILYVFASGKLSNEKEYLKNAIVSSGVHVVLVSFCSAGNFIIEVQKIYSDKIIGFFSFSSIDMFDIIMQVEVTSMFTLQALPFLGLWHIRLLLYIYSIVPVSCIRIPLAWDSFLLVKFSSFYSIFSYTERKQIALSKT